MPRFAPSKMPTIPGDRISRPSLHSVSLARRLPFFLLRRPLRRGRRHNCPHSKRLSTFALHVFLPFAPSSCRRQARLLLLRELRPLSLRCLASLHISERTPHALRLVH